MSAETPLMVRAFPVGRRTCIMTIPRSKVGDVSAMVLEWSPTAPHVLSPQELRQYRAGRDAALRELAAMVGGNVLVVEP